MAAPKSFGTGSSEKAALEASATRSTESFAANITGPDSHHSSGAKGSESPKLGISVHGPGASIETAIEVAEATKKLLSAVAEEMGVPPDALAWQIGSVQFKCDGCGLLRPDRPRPDEGWTYRDGDDLCPTCSKAAV